MRTVFKSKKFRKDAINLIAYCDKIMEKYALEGYDLSLRQLYYQLVSQNIIDNKVSEYKKLGNLVNDARLAGLLDWDILVDRGRSTIENAHWQNPQEILVQAANQFKIDKWEPQSNHIEVVCEKQSLEGILVPVCRKLDIPFSANKGYSSQSFLYRKGLILRDKILQGKKIIILYLGDHDPSGLDMARDVKKRLCLFALDPACKNIDVRRLALTMGQIDAYQLPPNPAKLTDTRTPHYISEFGDSSWELDALKPRVLADLVESVVIDSRDSLLWEKAVQKEVEYRKEILDIARTLGKNPK